MPNVWAEELRVFLRENERAIAAGEMALGTTFRHVIGRQAQVPGVTPEPAPSRSIAPELQADGLVDVVKSIALAPFRQDGG